MTLPPPRLLLLAPAGIFLALTAAGGWLMSADEHPAAARVMLAEGALYAAVSWWVLRSGDRLESSRSLAVILGTAVIARAILLPATPMSSDIYRYVWDGRVQAAGVNPYRHKPADPALAGLRDEAIYPHINRADTAVTVYPPAAQIVFLAATRLGETVTVMKAAMVAFEGLAAFALIRLLAARGLPRVRVLLYAWHPLPLFEFAGSGHIDAVAIGLMMAAMLLADRRRPFLSGMLLAAGAAAKYAPAVIGPALYRRWDWRMPAGFALALALLYGPYLGVGAGVLGYLPGYVEEEGIRESGIFWLALVTELGAPGWLRTAYLGAAGLGLAGLGLAVAFRREPGLIAAAGAIWLLAAFTLALTPHYPWYFTWLVPILCLRPSASLVWLTAAAPLLHGAMSRTLFASEVQLYLPFLVILCVETVRSVVAPALKETGHERRLGHQPAA